MKKSHAKTYFAFQYIVALLAIAAFILTGTYAEDDVARIISFMGFCTFYIVFALYDIAHTKLSIDED